MCCCTESEERLPRKYTACFKAEATALNHFFSLDFASIQPSAYWEHKVEGINEAWTENFALLLPAVENGSPEKKFPRNIIKLQTLLSITMHWGFMKSKINRHSYDDRFDGIIFPKIILAAVILHSAKLRILNSFNRFQLFVVQIMNSSLFCLPQQNIKMK